VGTPKVLLFGCEMGIFDWFITKNNSFKLRTVPK
jgi:hypothetical protein